MKIWEAVQAVRKFWTGRDPERVLYYGPHAAIWGSTLSDPLARRKSCWFCGWCGRNESSETWTDADAYAQAIGHQDAEHPGESFTIVRERL